VPAGAAVRDAWGGFSSPPQSAQTTKELSRVTAADGTLMVRYHAPQASGKQVVVAEVERVIEGGRERAGAQFEKHVDVRVPGLIPMPDSPYLFLSPYLPAQDPDDPLHPDEHFVSDGLAQKLLLISQLYYDQCGQQQLELNDMSLAWGGLFDYLHGAAHRWRTPHATHRKGTNCDIRWRQFGWHESPCLESILEAVMNDSSPPTQPRGWQSEPDLNHYHVGLGTNQ
jgi:hypothetical protein